MTTANRKSNSGTSFSTILIFLVITVSAGVYWYNTKDSSAETYEIKSAGSEFLKKPSYINRTGKEVEDKKITLSDGFWTKGKFDF